eukprot:1138089-Pelagomonas_calceolata.AAC.9
MPGNIFLVDFDEHRVVEDKEMKERCALACVLRARLQRDCGVLLCAFACPAACGGTEIRCDACSRCKPHGIPTCLVKRACMLVRQFFSNCSHGT